jgi:hypothetical protein
MIEERLTVQFADGGVWDAAALENTSVVVADIPNEGADSSQASLVYTLTGDGEESVTSSEANNNKNEQFNPDSLVMKFDQTLAATPELTSWALSSTLLNFHLGSSDIAAIGGDLAYQYAKQGNLSNVSLAPAQALLGNPQFGVGNQNLQPAHALQDLSPRLM